MTMKRRHVLLALLITALALPTAAFSQDAKKKTDGKKGKRVTRVVVDAVREEPYRQTIPILGRFVARQSGVIAARVRGAIEEFRVDVGDRVKAGDVLAVLAKSRLKFQHDLKRSEVSRYSAQFKTKRQQIELLRQELKRLDSLKKSPAFSQARRDDKMQQIVVAESQAAEAQAQLNMARANSRLTEIDLKEAEVRAPHSGVVSHRHVSVGAYVNVGAPVVTLLDDETMEIEADVPAGQIGGLKPHTVITARVNRTQELNAQVRAVIPEENPRTRTRAVRFTPALPDTSSIFATNQSVTLYLPAGAEKTVLTVHKDAVMTRKGQKVVVLAIDGKAKMQPVKLGPPAGSRFIVEDGLKIGDLAIVRGNERLLPGTAIQYKKAGDKPAAVKGNAS
ncbi:MAG: efflux RND transporter periplasmic adaptor subunit [Rhodospirillaceae bacterium]|nr:efflux RND transporter periplasmic adaptor subunit [Rhodospirillaceae bacterium]